MYQYPPYATLPALHAVATVVLARPRSEPESVIPPERSVLRRVDSANLRLIYFGQLINRLFHKLKERLALMIVREVPRRLVSPIFGVQGRSLPVFR